MNPFIRAVLTNRNKPEDWAGQGFLIAEMKYDGHRCTIVNDAGTIRAFGRKASDDIWPQLRHSMGDFILPEGTAVDGEIYVISGGSHDVKTALNAGQVRFVGFDVPYVNGSRNIFRGGPAGFEDRDLTLRGLKFDVPDRFDFVWMEGIWKSLRDGMDREAEERGIEGFVLKASASHGWWRQKPLRTVDCVITQINEGERRLTGTLGSFTVALVTRGGLQEVANVGSGFTDQERQDLWEIRETLVGEVIEVAYDTVQVSRLRFPRFLKFRPDKPQAECGIKQIEALQL